MANKNSTKKKEEIKKYLNYKFINGRVYISTEEKSGGLHGVYGLGHISNNFGLKIVKRNKPTKTKKEVFWISEIKKSQ